MKTKFLFFILFFSVLSPTKSQETLNTSHGKVSIHPIGHASFVLKYSNKTIFVDPHGDLKKYNEFPEPNLILLTDIHGDHLNLKILDKIKTSNAQFIVPQAVANKLPEKYKDQLVILKNEQTVSVLGFSISAIAMYNLPETIDSKHPKGRGNGYILTIDNRNIYISGDTEDIIEMRNLRNIDLAFICMNLPYTMDINQAASAVLEFKPSIVYPYHYRGKNSQFLDIQKFKKLVTDSNKNIEVRLRNWYPKK